MVQSVQPKESVAAVSVLYPLVYVMVKAKKCYIGLILWCEYLLKPVPCQQCVSLDNEHILYITGPTSLSLLAKARPGWALGHS